MITETFTLNWNPNLSGKYYRPANFLSLPVGKRNETPAICCESMLALGISAHVIKISITTKNPRKKGWTRVHTNDVYHISIKGLRFVNLERNWNYLRQIGVWTLDKTPDFWVKIKGVK